MRVCQSNTALSESLEAIRASGSTIGFVPTMGALHRGHGSLIEQAKRESDYVVCSIFVNPTQFNRKEDFDTYPKTLEKDQELLVGLGCDCLYAPSVEDIYPANEKIAPPNIDLHTLTSVLEGKFRPGHFEGVVQVVHRLFEIVRPNKAFFGEKDFQQLIVVRRMAQLLAMPVEVIGCPTVREESGLAMSSRNALLSETGREKARAIYQTLAQLNQPNPTATLTTKAKLAFLELSKQDGIEPEYLEVVNGSTLLPVNDSESPELIVACAAAWVENVRLIDNVTLHPGR